MTQNRPTIGLALSGGGVRGLAHLGVLKVFEEAHIPVDYLAGTSMGGIVSAVYAAGLPIDEAIAFAQRMGLTDIASPPDDWHGLFGHNKLAKLLGELLGSEALTFEDLQIPLSVIATDIETGEMVVFNEGPLIPALLATSAFPIMFTPVRYQGRWFVDGGVLNNFPVDWVRRMGADRVVGVTTPPSVQLNMEDSADEAADEMEMEHSRLSLRALFSSFSLPALEWHLPLLIAETATGYTVSLVSQQRLRLSPPDLLLEVHLPNMGTFATQRSAEAIAAGQQATREALPALRKLRDTPKPPGALQAWRRWRRRLARAWAAFNAPDYSCFP